jgi:condensin complex protein MksE
MEVPLQTADIFKILSKGQFINSNSSNKAISDLYGVIEDEQNFENLYEYFKSINFILEKGDEYYYFSRPENKVDLETKIEAAFRWIDIIDFLKTYDNSFSAGYRFTPSDILVRIKTDAELETKLEGLKKHTDKEKHQDILDKILKKLIDDTFIELENEITHQYKVMASFRYLEQLLLIINISDDVKNEIPQ